MPCSQNFPFGFKSADIDGFPIQFSDLAQLQVYAERVGASGSGMPASVREVVIASLATNRIIYCKSKQGDCGSPTQADLGAGAGALKYTGAGLSTASGLGSVGALGGTFAAGTAASTALAGATLGIGLLAMPLLSIFAHHAQAVAAEQGTLCGVAAGWNGFAMAMEQALPAGKIGNQDADTQIGQLHDQLIGMLSGIEKPVNAAAHYHKALDALLIFNREIVIPKLSGGLLSGLKGKLLVGGAILGGAKLVGAF
jgi:hypothetical protein